MKMIQFSGVQVLNLSALMTVRDCVQQDLITACCTFGLSAEQARGISALSIDQILVLVQHVGQESLFLPRQDLTALLALPAPLAGAITAVHPPHLATPANVQQPADDTRSNAERPTS